MTAAVDLVAVARARTALRALAVAHPELTAPAAQERAARWLADPDLEVNMSRKLSTEEDSVQLGIRLPRSLLSALDVEVSRLSALVAPELRGVVNLTRSDAVRTILQRALAPVATSAPSAPAQVPVDAGPSAPVAVPIAAPDLEARVWAALERAAPSTTRLVNLPDLAALVPELAPAAVVAELLRLDAAHRIELRPWSSVDALTPAQRAWCPSGHDGAPLGCARMLAPVAPGDQAPAVQSIAAPAPDLRARFEAAATTDPKRVNNSTASRALETTEVRIRRWRKGGDLPPELAQALTAWLEHEGFE